MTLENLAGEHIYDILQKAVALAQMHQEDVTFDFNGTIIEVLPTDSFEHAKAHAEKELGIKIQSREEDAKEAGERLEQMKQKQKKAISDSGAMTEQQMHDAEVIWPKTKEELIQYIDSLVNRPHDYGTCIYAMSMAAVAAFYYVSGQLDVTGFQASCADMDILRRTRNFKWGKILNYENLLYPQYCNDPEEFPSAQFLIEQNKEELSKRAKEKLADGTLNDAVKNHWEYLASLA